MTMIQKTLLVLGILLYAASAVFAFTRSFDFSNHPERLEFKDLSEAVQEGIKNEAARNQLTVEEFTTKYVFSTKGFEREINKALGLAIGIVLLFPLYYTLLTKLIHKKDLVKSATKFSDDEVRIHHLQEIFSKLNEFAALNDRYPSEDEFTDLVNHFEETIKDPQEGKHVHADSHETFKYSYDQYNPKTQRTEQTYFHLWCYLENGTKYELSSTK